MSKKNPRQKFAEIFQAAKEQCELSKPNLEIAAGIKCAPTMSQIATLRDALNPQERDIALERAEGSTDKHILSAHSAVKPQDLENYKNKLKVVEWLSNHDISLAQAKAFKELALSGATVGRDIQAVLASKFNEKEFYVHTRGLLGNDADDIYAIRSLPKSTTEQELQDAIDGKTVTKLNQTQRDLVKKLGTASTDHIELTPAEMILFRDARKEIKLSDVRNLEAYIKNNFEDENAELPENDVLACFQKDSSKDLSGYNYDEKALDLVLPEGELASRTPAEFQAFHDVGVAFSSDVAALTPAHLDKIKGLVEGSKLTAADLTAIAAFKTATATADDVINVAELVKAGIATSDIKTALSAQGVAANQAITFTTGNTTKTIDAAKVTATLIAAKNSWDGQDTTLKAIKTKAVVEAVNDLKAASYADNKIIAASGIQSDKAISTDDLKTVIQKFKNITNGDTTETQIANVRAAYNTEMDKNVNIRSLFDIAEFDAASPSEVERNVQKEFLTEYATSNPSVSSLEAAAATAAGGKPSKVLEKVREALREEDATIESLKIAALKAYKNADQCTSYKAVGKLLGVVKSQKDLLPTEFFHGIKTLDVSHIAGLSGTCSIAPEFANLIMKLYGRDDGVETNCNLKQSFGSFIGTKREVESETPDADIKEVLFALHDKYAEKGLVREADVNKALGKCDSFVKVFEFFASVDYEPYVKGINSTFVNTAIDKAQEDLMQYMDNKDAKLSDLVASAVVALEDNLAIKDKTDSTDFEAFDIIPDEVAGGLLDFAAATFCKGYFDPVFKKPCDDFTAFKVQNRDKDGNEIVCPESDNTIAGIITGTVIGSATLALLAKKAADVWSKWGDAALAENFKLDNDNFALTSVMSDTDSVINKELVFSPAGVAKLALKDIVAKKDSCTLTKAKVEFQVPITFEGSICFTGKFDDELYMRSKDSKGKILKEFKSEGFDKPTNSCDKFVTTAVNWCFAQKEYDYKGAFELDIKTGGTGFFDGEFELINA